jgi:tryptophan synthase beta chain
MSQAPERGTAAPLFHTTDYQFPDASGHFGPYGGSFVAETLSHALAELREAYERYSHDQEFLDEFRYELKHFVGRPSPIYHAKRWSEQMGGAQIFFKREDLNHTGAHKINCWRAAWASRASSPRPAPASMAWPRPPSARVSAWNA